jgi:holo-[acyl-carrier protein] synthase
MRLEPMGERMIIAVGTDIVALERIRKILASSTRDRFLERTFTLAELEYCLAKPDPTPSLAARFAAKEAFQKCWPETHGWTDVWIEIEGVKPKLKFSANLEPIMIERGWHAHVSVSHEKEFAVATVILEER